MPLNLCIGSSLPPRPLNPYSSMQAGGQPRKEADSTATCRGQIRRGFAVHGGASVISSRNTKQSLIVFKASQTSQLLPDSHCACFLMEMYTGFLLWRRYPTGHSSWDP